MDLQKRYFIVIAITILVAVVYLVRLFQLQVISTAFKESAEQNALRYITEHPTRGLIYDRNDSLMVYNDAAYDLMVVPSELRPFDTVELCQILDITSEDLMKRLDKARSYSQLIPSLVFQQMSKQDYGYLQEKLYKFPGFFVQNRTLRHYPKPIAAHILGYVGEVNYFKMEQDPYYQLGDYIGVSGIEKAYEEELRGKKGKRVVLVDVNNREQGSYKDGADDILPVQGQTLWSTLDMNLQEYGEKLMANKRGSIVAIEPSTGEILCVVSTPTYDPNLLVGKDRGKNYAALTNDQERRPLFNRALMAMYPPGSTFKLANGLIALQEGVMTPEKIYSCNGGYHMGSHTVNCHSHASSTDLIYGIQTSCNTYFCKIYHALLSDREKYKNIQEAYTHWRNHILSLGFGQIFDTDLPYETKGIIPTAAYFDKIYRGHWNGNTVISMSIGQGEASVTPLQMANFMAVIANKGYYYKPHIVKAIGTKDAPNSRYIERVECGFDRKYFEPIIKGMEMAALAGTARWVQIPDITMLAKTGTAQNPHGEDHSVFVSISPKENPQIVVFVLVENGGFGATVAGPVASLITEFYINRKVERTDLEERIINMETL